jgi:hypothetical protein
LVFWTRKLAARERADLPIKRLARQMEQAPRGLPFGAANQLQGGMLEQDEQIVRGDSALPNPRCNNALVDTPQSGNSGLFTRAAQPVADGVRTGKRLLEYRRQRRIVLVRAQVFPIAPPPFATR